MSEESIKVRLYLPGPPRSAGLSPLLIAAEAALNVRFNYVETDANDDEFEFSPNPVDVSKVALDAGKGVLLCTEDRRRFFRWLNRPRELNPIQCEMSDVVISLPFGTDDVPLIADCAARVGLVGDAFWGDATSARASAALLGMVPKLAAPNIPPPFGLPAMKGLMRIPTPFAPVQLGWLNYWSPATCRLLGFPDPTRDADLLTRSRELPNGAWLVQLTVDPLDPAARPDHVRALADAYARFPAIGGRDVPSSAIRG